MKITVHTPLRISFVGGSSDIDQYYIHHPGKVVSSTINLFIRVHIATTTYNINKKFFININNQKQEADSVDQILNEYVRTVLKFYKISQPLTIIINSDIPGGTGLGSSSSLITGLIQALHVIQYKTSLDWYSLAQRAYFVEKNLLKQPVGQQDHCIAAHGGIATFDFLPDHSVKATKLQINEQILEQLGKNFYLIPLGATRESNTILRHISVSPTLYQKNIVKKLANFCNDFIPALQKGDVDTMGKILHKSWLLKKKLHQPISNSKIDKVYRSLLESGICGGKVLGAGGGGFLLVCCYEQVKSELLDLYNLQPFKFYHRGSIILNNE